MGKSEACCTGERFSKNAKQGISLRQGLTGIPKLDWKVDNRPKLVNNLLTKACREMDHYRKVELGRSILQTSADSQLLGQANETLIQIGNSLNAVEVGLARQETQRGMEFTMIQNSHHVADCLATRLSEVASMSKDQNQILLDKLEQLQNQIGELQTSHDQAYGSHSSPGEIAENIGQDEQSRDHADDDHINTMSECIKRLSSLATKPKGNVFSFEAQVIISDLENILAYVSKVIETNEIRKQKHDQIADEMFVEASRKSQLQTDFGKMRGLLTSSELVAVNQGDLSSGLRLAFR